MNSNFALIGLGMRFQIYNGEAEITGTKERDNYPTVLCTAEIGWYTNGNNGMQFQKTCNNISQLEVYPLRCLRFLTRSFHFLPVL